MTARHRRQGGSTLLDGFWIANPADVVHLVARADDETA
jgi:hypothetical protein